MTAAIDCTHLRNNIGTREGPFGVLHVYGCACQAVKETTLGDCLTCPHYLVAKPDPQRPQRGCCRHPDGVVVDRCDRNAGVADLYRGASCFLVCGGPSLKTLNLELLRKRGVLIMSMNNCPAGLPEGIRPHIWIHTDPTGKFHDSIWRDPAVLKFAAVNRWNSVYVPGKTNKDGDQKLDGIRKRRADGQGFEALAGGIRAIDMPGVLGYQRNANFDPAHWLFEPSFNFGNDKQHAEGLKGHRPNGWDNVINTMFTAVRLAFYLGIAKLYLVGADFTMDANEPYAFDQGKSEGGCNGCNHAYAKMATMFTALRPSFEEAGFEVINCTPNSGLWAFDYLPLEDAIAAATDGFEEVLNGKGWYDSVAVEKK